VNSLEAIEMVNQKLATVVTTSLEMKEWLYKTSGDLEKIRKDTVAFVLQKTGAANRIKKELDELIYVN
jgi:hypothetical protein